MSDLEPWEAESRRIAGYVPGSAYEVEPTYAPGYEPPDDLGPEYSQEAVTTPTFLSRENIASARSATPVYVQEADPSQAGGQGGRAPGYAEMGAYGHMPEYAQQGGRGVVAAPAQTPGYGYPAAYAQTPSYAQTGAYAQEPTYAQATFVPTYQPDAPVMPGATGGFAAQATGGFVAQGTGGFAAQRTGGFAAQGTGGFAAQGSQRSAGAHTAPPGTTGSFAAQATGGFAAQATGGFAAQPATAGAYGAQSSYEPVAQPSLQPDPAYASAMQGAYNEQAQVAPRNLYLSRSRQQLAWPLRYLRAWGVCLGVFFALLFLVELVPKDLMRPAFDASATFMREQGDYPETYFTTQMRVDVMDNFTAALSLNIALHTTGNPLVDALRAPYWYDEDLWQVENLAAGADKEPNTGYARYWHGYLALLVPLLATGLDIIGIRTTFLVLMLVLAAVACALAAKRTNVAVAIGLAFSLVVVNLWVAAVSTPLAPCFFVALAAVVYVAAVGGRTPGRDPAAQLSDEQVAWGVRFFVIGAITCYVDFLDTPLVSLGLPLATLLAVRRADLARLSWPQALLFGTVCVGSWFAGYALLWVSKWLLAALFLGPDVLGEALSTVAERAGNAPKERGWLEPSRLEVIGANIQLLDSVALWRLAVLPALGWLAALGVAGPRRGWSKPFAAQLVVALLPILWYLVVSNHSWIHRTFTYRELCVSVYALFLALETIVDWEGVWAHLPWDWDAS